MLLSFRCHCLYLKTRDSWITLTPQNCVGGPRFCGAVVGDRTRLQRSWNKTVDRFQNYNLVNTLACQGSLLFQLSVPPISTTEDHGWHQKISYPEAVWQMVGCVVTQVDLGLALSPACPRKGIPAGWRLEEGNTCSTPGPLSVLWKCWLLLGLGSRVPNALSKSLGGHKSWRI